MRVVADRNVCVGAGMCVLTAPGVFDQDEEEGLVSLLVERPGPAEIERVRRAVDLCPSGALSLEEASFSGAEAL
jgi:ferredoxin